MKVTTIRPATIIELRTALAIFFGAFAALWLLLEPLTAFGLLPTLDGWMKWAIYACLVIASLGAVRLSVPAIGWFRGRKMSMIQFTVVSSSDGLDHDVRAPASMMVGSFVSRFLEHLETGPAADAVRSLRLTHEPVLQLPVGTSMEDALNHSTLEGAGLASGMRCVIRGKPRRQPRVMFSKSRPESGSQYEEAAALLQFLDEQSKDGQ